MPKRHSNAVAEPQAVFGFLAPAEFAPHFAAVGGLDPFSAEPPRGRSYAKIRELGQVATPRPLAYALASWVTVRTPSEILDPGCGLGNLLHASRALHPTAHLEGIDIDPEMIAQAQLTAPPGTSLFCGDYLRMHVHPRAAIIANPPYVKAARLDYGESDWAALENLLGCSLDRLTNTYALFLLKIWHDLAAQGRAAVLIPREFLNANYGVEIKRQLLRRLRPKAILVLDPALNVFDTALTTSAILLLEKSPTPRSHCPAYCVRDLVTLQKAIAALASDPADTSPAGLLATDCAELDPQDKWLNRILGQHVDHDAFTHRIGDFFRCSRGIATGANEYFCLRPSELKTHRLSGSDFLPCITKAVDVDGLVFTHTAFARLQEADRRCWLLAPKAPDTAMNSYLTLGQQSGIPDRFFAEASSGLVSSRKP
jgi:adenine-specific DNA-methyltransferase